MENPETEIHIKLEDIVLLADTIGELANEVYKLHVKILKKEQQKK